ncbi:Lrp/AsnC family transcriptional regulator [Ornithinimicrobium avium]|uniref:Lrp/AsnC family transcriptional regulator n=1 Tax=Ornithinimicrobium avium TaxID=2283195 RepID=A0A345NN28_9MICO|nr:Lrp/AsnC family transcriptional regulator [Ornithinimicrobium avium]AXH96436.1 Lrp/AsnC family transcriptional regulator [Ornithinimicrobium avium]
MDERSSSTSDRRTSPVARQVAHLDDTDRAMIDALRADGRLSVRALADQVHISRANAYARLERLRREGVITGFTATVDPDRMGLGTAAFVSVSIEQDSWRRVTRALSELPGVERISLVGAEFDILVQVRAHDNHELRDVVLGQIQSVPGVRGTRTWLIFDEVDVRAGA